MTLGKETVLEVHCFTLSVTLLHHQVIAQTTSAPTQSSGEKCQKVSSLGGNPKSEALRRLAQRESLNLFSEVETPSKATLTPF